MKKTRAIVMIVCALAIMHSAQFANSSIPGRYSARLISPTAGQVLRPGQVVRVEWRSQLPNIYLSGCEMEVYLSTDGGRTFTEFISPQLDAKATHFFWTVPNTPTNAAELDIRFGCEGYFPESYAPQPSSMFAIVADTSDS